MKYFPRFAPIFGFFVIVLVALCTITIRPASAQLTWDKSQKNAPVSVIQSVQVIPDKDGATVEIVGSRAITPQISRVDSPSRLVIDLPNTVMPHRKRFGVHSGLVSTLRMDQYSSSPAVTRAVVDLLASVSYVWENAGDRLIIHVRPAESANPASVPAFTQGVQPAVVPVTQGNSGAVMLAGSRIAGGSAVTAGSDTAILHLARGGEVRVCPGTTVSVTPSQNGRDLMLGMNTGALEAHYSLQTSADSVLTPDFRMMLAGPGEFDFAISSDARGNTCVRSLPGNTASIIVSELMGDGTYQVRPTEQVVFHAGSLTVRDKNAPVNCGCPSPRPGTIVASNDAPHSVAPNAQMSGTLNLAQTQAAKSTPAAGSAAQAAPQQINMPHVNPGTSTTDKAPQIPGESRVSVVMLPSAAKSSMTDSASAGGISAVPTSKANDVHVVVDAPFVFRASDQPQSRAAGTTTEKTATLATYPPSAAAKPAQIALPPAQETPASKPTHHGFMGKIKGFFSAIFR